jgi:hypothetical protein
VVLPGDVRTGFNFKEAESGVYTSANALLRSEWAFWRKTAPRYGFGRTELLPVKSNEEGLSKYVGKYIAKHVGAREQRDKGVRLVRYSKGASIGSNAFMFVSPRSRLWRWQVSEFARRNGCADLDALKARFGPKWAHFHGPEIRSLAPPPISYGETNLPEIFMVDRIRLSGAVASAAGSTHADAFVMLFQPWAKLSVEFNVPRFTGVSVRRQQREDEWERTVTWADGTSTRLPVSEG